VLLPIFLNQSGLRFLETLTETKVLLQIPSYQFAHRPVDDFGPVGVERFAVHVKIEGDRMMDVQWEVLRLTRAWSANGSRHASIDLPDSNIYSPIFRDLPSILAFCPAI
jgi:hypothetical protein